MIGKKQKHQTIGFIADELELIGSSFAFDEGCMDIKSVNDFYMMGSVVKCIQEICAIDNAQTK